MGDPFFYHCANAFHVGESAHTNQTRGVRASNAYVRRPMNMAQRKIHNTLKGGGTWSGFANQKSMDAYIRKNVELGEHRTNAGVIVERCNAYPRSDRPVSATKLSSLKFYHSDGTCVMDVESMTQLQGINYERTLNSWRVVRKVDIKGGDFGDNVPEVGTDVCPRAGNAYKVVKATKPSKPAKRKPAKRTTKPAKPTKRATKPAGKAGKAYSIALPNGEVLEFRSSLAPDSEEIKTLVAVRNAWQASVDATGVKLSATLEL